MTQEQKVTKVNELRKAGMDARSACKKIKIGISAYNYHRAKAEKAQARAPINLEHASSGKDIRVVVMEGDSASIGEALGKLFSR